VNLTCTTGTGEEIGMNQTVGKRGKTATIAMIVMTGGIEKSGETAKTTTGRALTDELWESGKYSCRPGLPFSCRFSG
jgi:hypothetical protein